MLKRFDRYILKDVFPPFLIGLLATSFVLLMNQVLSLTELFIEKGVPAAVAAQVLVLLVPSILAFAVPMAVLVGILGGLARLSADSETVAFETLGIGPGRLLRPLLVFGVCGWALASGLALYLAPWANFQWIQTMTSSVLTRVELRINPLEFNESIPGMVLFIQNVSPDKTWENVFVYLSKDPANPRVIVARKGRIRLDPEKRRATLELSNGALHAGPVAEPEKYSVTSFDRLEEEIDVENLFPSLTSEKRVREKDIGELLGAARALRADLGVLENRRLTPTDPGQAFRTGSLQRDYRSHEVEIHKKFALPFVCFIFVLVGLPLGLRTGRGGRTSGFTMSLGIILLYYVLITIGEKLAVDGTIPPSMGMWGPDIFLLAVGLPLILKPRIDVLALPRRDRIPREPAALPPVAAAARPFRHRAFQLTLRFPNILDRYVSRKFLAIMGLVFSGLILVSAAVTFFERLDTVLKKGKPLGLLISYVWSRVPEFVTYGLPVASLVTTLLALGLLAKTNEVTAAKACGISLYRLIVPVILLALAASGLAFLVQERLAPAANAKAQETWRRIADLPPRRYSYVNRHWAFGKGKDRIYRYDYFEPSSSTFGRLAVFDLDLERWSLRRRAFAENAVLGRDSFTVRKGWVRDFAGTAAVPFAAKSDWMLPTIDGQGYFVKEWKEPDEMTYGELRSYAAEVRAMGFKAVRLCVDLGEKSALPLVSLIMAFLAIPFAFSFGKKGMLAGIGLGIVMAMVYWGAVGVFRGLGYAGILPPFLAAWAANLIFGLVGIFLMFRLRT